MNDLLLNDIIFIPNVSDRTTLLSGINYQLVCLNASSVQQFKNGLYKEIISQKTNILIDPQTCWLTYPSKREAKNYKELPYSSVNVNRMFAEPIYRQNELINKTIDYQISKKSSAIITPSLHINEVQSSNLSINTTLLDESILYVKHKQISNPLFASICLNINSLTDYSSMRSLISFYTDDSVVDNISGYFVTISEFNDREASLEELTCVTNFISQLSFFKKVIIRNIGSFGLILNAICNSSYISSPAGGESFSLRNIDSKYKPRRDHNEMIYIPELFDYVNSFESKRIGYICNCDACQQKITTLESKTSERKVHFLLNREKEVSLLNKLSSEEKIKVILEKIEKAISLSEQYISKGSKLNTNHLYRWRNILKNGDSFNTKSEDDKLEALLVEIDKE